jgi:DNA modification methylase
VLNSLEDIVDESVHTICTSPPYWQQRDYDTDGQLGTEDTVEAYVENIADVARECHRILRDDGSFLLNIGDTFTDKQRNLIPFRVAQQLSEEVGFVLRNDLVWAKNHAKPDPARDRRANEHEYVFHFTKDTEYWYDGSVTDGGHTSVIEAPTATSELDHVAVYSEELVKELLRGTTPPVVCKQCQQPYERQYDRVPRPFADPERAQSKRAYELYEESELTETHIEAIQAVGISDVGKAKVTEDGAGRNADDVRQLADEAKEVLGGYYREFTMIERIPAGWEQDCSCDAGTAGGVVCDPFIGSGTTGVVARKQGLRYLGVDINEEYLETAQERISEVDV